MRRKGRRGFLFCIEMIGVFFLTVFGLSKAAYAADFVDVEAKCSLAIAVPAELAEDVKDTEITVKLWQAASMGMAGDYISLPGYEKLKLEEMSNNATAKEWDEKALEAADVIGLASDKGNESDVVNADYQVSICDGSGMITGLNPGLYLVWAEPFETEKYRYESLPYLISFPDNHYEITGYDEWIYNVEIDIKLGREEKKAENPKTPGNPERVKTGDENLMLFWMAMIAVSGIAVISVTAVVCRIKNKKKE